MRRIFAFQEKGGIPSSGCILGTSGINHCSNNFAIHDFDVVEGGATSRNTLTKEEKRLQSEISKYLGVHSDSGEKGITPIKHIHQLDTWDCGKALFN